MKWTGTARRIPRCWISACPTFWAPRSRGKAGDYTLTVHYNPLGAAYASGSGNDASTAATTIALRVQKATGNATITNDISKAYDGSVVANVACQALSTGAVTPGVEIDDEVIGAQQYTADSGSTGITLPPSCLNALPAGRHTIAVLYTDGEARGGFIIAEIAAPPETGIIPWSILILISAGAILTLNVTRRRKRA